ncbi:MAG: pseudouridine synthase [Succinivibrionaceae bacterium]|nr:pseudouridine synthase [Succinivibrionaceae bacterium]
MAGSKRLDKFVTECFDLSRSNASRIIRSGAVSVNGNVVKDAGFKTSLGDRVRLNDVEVEVYDQLYLMINKPAGCVCANEDSHNPVVFSYLRQVPGINSCHCVGRLDLDTTGLLLITSDGQWSHRISSPKHHLGKTYHATLAEAVTDEQLSRLREGVLLTGEKKPTTPAIAERVSEKEIDLTIYEGKYHQVKRMIYAVGNEVVALSRGAIGSLSLDPELEPGQYRHLRADEIALF